MIFSKRYKDMLIKGDDVPDTSNFIGDIDYSARKRIVCVLKSFDEPKKIKISRYSNETKDYDAFTLSLMELLQARNIFQSHTGLIYTVFLQW